MALNSTIRKISLNGNCDLTNFHADIHDYEGFDKDNSLFMNKRKMNWWKRNSNTGELGAITGVADGDYFKIYKNSDSTYLGQISRNYYKLESIASSDVPSGLSSVSNPYPSNDNGAVFLFGEYVGKAGECTVRQCGDYYFVWKGGSRYYVYDSSGNLLDSKSITIRETYTPEYIDFYYSASGYTISHTYTGSSFETPTVTLTIPAGCVYVSARYGVYADGSIYDPSTLSTSSAVTVPSGFSGLSFYDILTRDGAARYYKDIDYGKQYCGWDFFVINGILFMGFYNWFSGYSTNNLTIYRQNESVYSGSPGQSAFNNYLAGFELTDWDKDGYTASVRLSCGVGDTEYYSESFTVPDSRYSYQIYNYSKLFGKWAVNFTNNEASSIAHDFKKLWEIEDIGSIDGYNDDYIYFHSGNNYYRISIDTASDFESIATSLNGVYYIFNTVSYQNALTGNNYTWFCSCDDWNDRAQWTVTSKEAADILVTSRLNDDWNTESSYTETSDKMAPVNRNIAVEVTDVEAYASSDTWDGSSYVYTASGNRVDTTSWNSGHTLSGYYAATAYETDASKITPFYIDSNYTCPQYEDHTGANVNQTYTVFFQVAISDSAQSLVQQGDLTAEGFTVDQDEGNIYSVPDSNTDYQRTPALLDTKFYVYTTNTFISNTEGTYKAMTVASLGGAWVLVYLNSTETIPLTEDDAVFCINGVEYTYKADTKRILDYNAQWVANTNMMKYVGFSTVCAYFYSEFDHAIYMFRGDNTFTKLAPLERFTPVWGEGKVDTLNIASLDVVLVNLGTACMIMYQDQYVLLETGTINFWSLDESTGVFNINGVLYSIIKSALLADNVEENEITFIPIEIETQFFGDPDTEANIINDCVYLTVDNLLSLPSGTVTIQAIGLQNQKVIEAPEKTISLKPADFNEFKMCLIKYQPKLQECKGFKLKITSDFEIAELKIGTSAGAMNQTTKRI